MPNSDADNLAANTLAAVSHRSGSVPEDLAFVLPELRLPARARLATTMEIDQNNLAQLRASLASAPAVDNGVSVERQSVAVEGGPDVAVYIINADKTHQRPAILHMHGGGYILGSAEGYVPRLQMLAAELDCAIVTVEYRLAPETFYTGSTSDNYSALLWVHRNAEALGIDRHRIAVMGESAGGGHAALLAIAARDRGEVPICFQMLVYPMIDDRTGSTRAPGKNIGTIGWTVQCNRFGWRSFLGREPGGADVPEAAAAARVKDLSDLPPAFIQVGGLDLFVEEDIDYARRLVSAGVATELMVVPGAYHGFDVYAPETQMAQRFTQARVDALKQAFAASTT